MANKNGEENGENNFIPFEATMKRHPKFECTSRNELLKMLSYMEGEIQARDVVIAALKSERVKQLIFATKHKPTLLTDPYAALFRDDLAVNGNLASRESSVAASNAEQDSKVFANHQLEHLHRTVNNQRQVLIKLSKLLTETKDNYLKLLEEFEKEKRKNDNNNPVSDAEKANLRMVFEELGMEKSERKKVEDELKKIQSQLENERAKQKQMILFLLGDRKQVIMKYNEERKRSEDLAQILSEEKQRVDTIAEGLEEESKKSLRMEAELEKQAQTFEMERKTLKGSLAKEEKRVKEQELEIIQLRTECETLKKNMLAHATITASGSGAAQLDETVISHVSSVAKVVQPTATVSSVPVSGPTTGVARSIASGQTLRANSSAPETSGFVSKTAPRKIQSAISSSSAVVQPQTANTATINPPNAALKMGGAGASPSAKKAASNLPLGRGVPPPIPPNKPMIPPKRDGSSSRIVGPGGSANGGGGAIPSNGNATDISDIINQQQQQQVNE